MRTDAIFMKIAFHTLYRMYKKTMASGLHVVLIPHFVRFFLLQGSQLASTVFNREISILLACYDKEVSLNFF